MDTSYENIAREAADIAAQATNTAETAQRLAQNVLSVHQTTGTLPPPPVIEQLDAATHETLRQLGRIRDALKQLRVIGVHVAAHEVTNDETAALLPSVTFQYETEYRAAEQLAAQYRASFEQMARIHAAQQGMNTAPTLETLQREQKDAEDLVRSLLAEQPELRRLAKAQDPAVRQSLEILARKLKDRDAVRQWLNVQLPDLGMQTALDFIRAGRAHVVEKLLSDALLGIPS